MSSRMMYVNAKFIIPMSFTYHFVVSFSPFLPLPISQERQMMASSWLIMTAAVSFSYASPLDHMHPLRSVTEDFMFFCF